MKTKIISLIVALFIATGALAQVETPSQLYGQLFEDVQMQRVFPDNKAFVDAVPNSAPTVIMQRYQEERGAPGFDLAAFVQRNFTMPGPKESTYRSTPGEDVCTHIDNLWRALIPIFPIGWGSSGQSCCVNCWPERSCACVGTLSNLKETRSQFSPTGWIRGLPTKTCW